MNYRADDLIDLALYEEGYLEKKSAEMLDQKQENAGSGNFTKYARDLYRAGYYNGSKQGVAWCSVFVDWCHYMASGQDKELARRVTCQTGVYGASCTYSMRDYIRAGRFFEDPQPGDQVYFGTGNTAEHTGIVCGVDGDTLFTVEGNTSGQSGVVANGGGVFLKSYSRSKTNILGYGRPRYEDMVDPLSVVRMGDSGTRVKVLQLLLIGFNCPCGVWGADGKFGSATFQAVKKFQKSRELKEDGMAGPETWKKLLGVA